MCGLLRSVLKEMFIFNNICRPFQGPKKEKMDYNYEQFYISHSDIKIC